MFERLKYKIETNIDEPKTTIDRKIIVENNRILKKIYNYWYSLICENIANAESKILEIGSGAGFLEKYLPTVLTSDIIILPRLSLTQDAQSLAIASNSLDYVVMVNTFHHFPKSSKFLNELQRCLKVGGQLLMIEPWHTKASFLIYNYFHHEPFDIKIRKMGIYRIWSTFWCQWCLTLDHF